MTPQGLIAKVIETYTGRMCFRIGRMVDLIKKDHPEATEALNKIKAQVEMFSLVYGPGETDHPATSSVAPDLPRRIFTLPPESEPEPKPKPKPDRRLPPGGRSKLGRNVTGPVPIKRQRVLDLLTENPGLSNAEIARQVDCTPAYVAILRNKEPKNDNSLSDNE